MDADTGVRIVSCIASPLTATLYPIFSTVFRFSNGSEWSKYIKRIACLRRTCAPLVSFLFYLIRNKIIPYSTYCVLVTLKRGGYSNYSIYLILPLYTSLRSQSMSHHLNQSIINIKTRPTTTVTRRARIIHNLKLTSDQLGREIHRTPRQKLQ